MVEDKLMLQGGYNLRAISDSALAVAQVLLGETPAELGSMAASDLATEVMHEVAKVQSKYWKSIDTKACPAPEIRVIENVNVAVGIAELLKAYRTQHLFKTYDLFSIPLANEELDEAYHELLHCNEGLYDTDPERVLVIFVHDFGNLRVEQDNVETADISMTNSYLLDTTDAVVKWVLDNGWNLIDVNVLRQLPTVFAKVR